MFVKERVATQKKCGQLSNRTNVLLLIKLQNNYEKKILALFLPLISLFLFIPFALSYVTWFHSKPPYLYYFSHFHHFFVCNELFIPSYSSQHWQIFIPFYYLAHTHTRWFHLFIHFVIVISCCFFYYFVLNHHHIDTYRSHHNSKHIVN